MTPYLHNTPKVLKYTHRGYCKREQKANNKTSFPFLLPHFLHLPTGATTR